MDPRAPPAAPPAPVTPTARRRTFRVALWIQIPLWLGILAVSFALRRARREAPPRDEQEAAAERLRAFDASRRNGAAFAHLPTWDELSGPDPYFLAKLPGTPYVAGLLRGDDAVVVLDGAMQEVQRLPAPMSPVALAVAEGGAVFVAGEQSAFLARFQWQGARLEPAGAIDLGDLRAVRGIAAGANGWIYVAEEQQGSLVALRGQRERTEIGRCRGPIRVAILPGAPRLIANCLLDHRLVIHDLDPSGAPSAAPPVVIQHDGPIWSFDAVATNDALFVAAGGVEDHPLDRTIGAFGYIDSFLFLYRLDPASRTATRTAAIDVSALGVVTPKAIALTADPIAVTVAGYGSDKIAHVTFEGDLAAAPVLRVEPFVPGANAVIALDASHLAFANPLLDAWVVFPKAGPPDVHRIAERGTAPVDGGRRSRARDPELRLGEALFFTTLLAPFNSAEGALSRFTCETCHFEGYVDGRTHHTGRDDVHAVTKPLLGLFNNRPHFSRALDPDLTAVAFNEFRVAGAKSGHDPWFSLDPSAVPWLNFLDAKDTSPLDAAGAPSAPELATLSPASMRKALMSFLIAFQHRPNPAVSARRECPPPSAARECPPAPTFSERERRGATLFRDRCESCHEARLVSDQPPSRAPFERWETLVLAREGAIVWGKDVYAKTGVVPYVHEKGARVPSLRRLYKKHPYFTNGRADSLDDLLGKARWLPEGFRHDGPSEPSASAETQLDGPSREALRAFLDLL